MRASAKWVASGIGFAAECFGEKKPAPRGGSAIKRVKREEEDPALHRATKRFRHAAPRKGVEVLVLDSDVDSESSSEVEMFEIDYSSSESSGDDSSGNDIQV